MCCTSVALGSRATHTVGPHPMGMALPGPSIPVPELGRIFSPQGSLPKGEGAVGTGPTVAPHYCSEQQPPEWRGDGVGLC